MLDVKPGQSSAPVRLTRETPNERPVLSVEVSGRLLLLESSGIFLDLCDWSSVWTVRDVHEQLVYLTVARFLSQDGGVR